MSSLNVFLTVFLFSVLVGVSVHVGYLESEYEDGLSQVDNIELHGERVSLYSGCYRLDMFVSESQSEAIMGTEFNTSRPMTHDIITEVVGKSGFDVSHLEVHSYDENAYIADLVLDKGLLGSERIDIRPSDGIAVVNNYNKDVLIERELLQDSGEYYCDSEDFELI